MKRILIMILTVYCSLFIVHCRAQLQGQALIDSLLLELPKQKEDTIKVKMLVAISAICQLVNQGEGIELGKQGLALSNKIGWKNGAAMSYVTIGRNFWRKADMKEAMKNQFAALELYNKSGDKKQLAISNITVGQYYADSGNFIESIKYLSSGLNISLETGDKRLIAYAHGYLAWFYGNIGNLPEAQKNLYASLKICEETGDKEGQAVANSGIADHYERQGNYTEALRCYMQCLKVFKEAKDQINIFETYEAIGSIYLKIGNYPKAMENILSAKEVSNEINNPTYAGLSYNYLGDASQVQGNYAEALNNFLIAVKYFTATANKPGLADLFSKIGVCYTKLSRYNDAQKFFDDAISLSLQMDNYKYIAGYFQGIVMLDSATNRWQRAFEDHKMYIFYRDSLYGRENSKKIMLTKMQYEFDKKEEATKAEQDKKDITQRNIRNFTLAGMTGLAVFSVIIYGQRNRVKKEKEKVEKEKIRSEELLLNILPAEVAEELKYKGSSEAKLFDHVTVLFTDFVGFTNVSEKLSPKELVTELNTCFSAFDGIIGKYNIEKIKTVGDAYLAVCGLPSPDPEHAEKTVRAAIEICAFMEDRLAKLGNARTFQIRIGIHSGSVVAGIVGVKKFAYDIWGDTVNTAARMEQNCEAGKINISETTFELVKDKFNYEYRGEIEAKGKGVMKMYFVAPPGLPRGEEVLRSAVPE